MLTSSNRAEARPTEIKTNLFDSLEDLQARGIPLNRLLQGQAKIGRANDVSFMLRCC